MTGFCYAIADWNGLVKIGWSADPARRLNKIQADNGAACRLLGAVRSTREQEAELLELLRPWRERGEWFVDAGPVSLFVRMLALPARRTKQRAMKAAPSGGNGLRAWCIAAGITLKQLGERVQVKSPQLSRIEMGQKSPSLALACRLSQFTGIPAGAFSVGPAE